jgi:hypothetical protein
MFHLAVDFFTVNRNAPVCLDSQSDLVASCAQYRDCHVLADQERFSDPPGQYEHAGLLTVDRHDNGGWSKRNAAFRRIFASNAYESLPV